MARIVKAHLLCGWAFWHSYPVLLTTSLFRQEGLIHSGYGSLQTNPYFCSMQLSTEHQELVNFFDNRPLPAGPQHINPYSVFLNLPGAVEGQLRQLRSEVEASRKSAAIMLQEVRAWVIAQ